MGIKQLKNILMNIYLKKMKSNNLKKLKKVKKKMGHILSNSPNEKWQFDIFYLIKYHKQNQG